MLGTASVLMIRMGLALLLLSLLVRPAIGSEASRLADTLAIVASALVVAVGVVGRQVARRREPSPVPPPARPVPPRADWVQPHRTRTARPPRPPHPGDEPSEDSGR